MRLHPARGAAARLLGALGPAGRLSVWETEYLQALGRVAEGHPVRGFTGSTAMRPFLDRMSATEAAEFTARYDDALAAAYPLTEGGGALFPFRRLFLILERP